ncbi:terminase small subunit [Sphingorhabdus contaminans]|uniref:Terminase small subunit n=1 Tax=Sphingorhabdus contaminans TaxID=1343899 RepID=A0A553WH13_9SPHN|nr:terminase small subunit [Sphingorhabdus contaminans]TSB03975.1 terminase small subunit [Sphingorhabdus contaminans]
MTPKQEAFCLAYVETGNASEAYRRAYDAENMKPETINVQASKMLSDPKIAIRLAVLRDEHVERHNLTVDDLIAQLDEDRTFARDLKAPAAAITASMGKAKLLGFLTDKIEHSGIQNRQWSDEDIAVRAASIIASVRQRNPGRFEVE